MLGVCLKYTERNYGSKLQALATVEMFNELEQDYEILRYNKKTLHFALITIPRFFNYVFLNDRYDQFQRIIEFKRHPQIKAQVDKRNELFAEFDKQFKKNLSPFYKSYLDLKSRCPENYEKVITCSDQLWSPSALASGFYNLMFAPDDMPKISWASSFGVTEIPWYQKTRTKRFLKRIENVSMRETRGAEIVKELTGRDVPVLMDPVFVYDEDKWDELVPSTAPEWDNYIFCYFLGSNPEHRAAARELSEKTGMKIVTLRHLDRYNAQDEDFGDFAPYDVDPNRFLNILRNASYICTDSFHGTAFSVIFKKKFIVFDRYNEKSGNSKNSRIKSVCDILGLNDRRYSKKKDILTAMTEDINYTEVSEKVSQYQRDTLEYLKQAFK